MPRCRPILLPWTLSCLSACAGDPPGGSGRDDTTAADTAAADTDTPETGGHPWSSHCVSDDIAPTSQAEGDGVQVTTPHFVLYLEGEPASRPEEYGRLAEALWLALEEVHEGALPSPLPLDARVYASAAAWQAGMATAGVVVPKGAGGYYDPGSRIASLYVQPTIYYTQTLFIHEVLHQIHALARLGGSNRATWYIEGVAEHFSRHEWDGECLRLGVTSLLSYEDMPAAAEAQLSTLDLDAALASDAFPGRPSMFGLVRALDLREADHEAFTRFRARYDADGGDPVALLEEVGLGELDAAALAAWIPQEPLTAQYLEWVPETGDRLYGFADVLSFARLKETPATFSATLAAGSGLGGVVLGYAGPDDWEVLLLDGSGGVSVFGLDAGVVRWDNVAAVAAPAGPVTLSVSASTIRIDGASLDIPRVHPAAAGVALYDDVRQFTDLTWSR